VALGAAALADDRVRASSDRFVWTNWPGMNASMPRDFEPTDPAALAEQLGISAEAVALTRSADVIDLHLDTFLAIRMWGYDVRARHGLGFFRGYGFGHMDIPRAFDAGLSGGMWSITTNPFRTAAGRWATFQKNLAALKNVVETSSGYLKLARNVTEYQEAKAAGAHAVFVAVQGGNCFDESAGYLAAVPDQQVIRVTVIHLTNSDLGTTSTPFSILRRNKGLTAKGRAYVEALNAQKVFVDLAHVHPDGFWDAVEVHDKTQPLIDTHTGVAGIRPHWRNLDDDQLKAIADTGGTVGIIYSQFFLEGEKGHKDGQMIVEHMQHVIDVVGEDFVSVGSDYDGAIVPPLELRSGGDTYPILVQRMLDRGWSEERIRKVLGGNFLRALKLLRG
jgi:membrane dipeptidase